MFAPISDRIQSYRQRRVIRPEIDNVSFVPLPGDFHPVFRTHRLHLQDKTSLPWPWVTLHVINRRPKAFPGYRYIAEVESLFSILHKEHTRSQDFTLKRGLQLIEEKIRGGELKKIIFQSTSAFKLYEEYFTPAIAGVSEMVQVVPHEILRREAPLPGRAPRILVVGTNIMIKGLFMLPSIVSRVRARNPEARFTLVCSEPSDRFTGIEGLDVLFTPRMSEEIKRDLFLGHDFFLNMSLGDALGVFLDCLRYNLPMITFPGQHGNTFVPESVGISVESPYFVYGRNEFCKKYNLGTAQMCEHIQKLVDAGEFREVENELVRRIEKMDLGEGYRAMLSAQYEFGLRNFRVDKWLADMNAVYRSLE